VGLRTRERVGVNGGARGCAEATRAVPGAGTPRAGAKGRAEGAGGGGGGGGGTPGGARGGGGGGPRRHGGRCRGERGRAVAGGSRDGGEPRCRGRGAGRRRGESRRGRRGARAGERRGGRREEKGREREREEKGVEGSSPRGSNSGDHHLQDLGHHGRGRERWERERLLRGRNQMSQTDLGEGARAAGGQGRQGRACRTGLG
jgi:hypothetical protein